MKRVIKQESFELSFEHSHNEFENDARWMLWTVHSMTLCAGHLKC